jgi:hypothetical protein
MELERMTWQCLNPLGRIAAEDSLVRRGALLINVILIVSAGRTLFSKSSPPAGAPPAALHPSGGMDVMML